MLGWRLRPLGFSSRGTEQESERAEVVLIPDLAHNLFKDVLQRDESQNPPVYLTHQSHGTVGLEKQLERHGHVVVGLQEAGRIEGILQNDRSPQDEEMEQILGVDNPDDVVQITLMDAKTGQVRYW
jgi:hypothetical protein